MTLREKQEQWIEDYRVIQDRQERLAVIVDQARTLTPLDEALRTDNRLVRGCVSSVWLHGLIDCGDCQFSMAADSVIAGGLAGLLCRLYSGHPPEDVVATEPEILQALQLDRQVSPTRMNGLYHVRQAIKAFARRHVVP